MGRGRLPRKGLAFGAKSSRKGRESCMMQTGRMPDEKAPQMNAQNTLSFEEMLRIKLEVMKREHRDLDEAILALELSGRPDQLTLRRLKKQKLALKDQITRIEDQMIPDIIA
jgi:hypothetical protein